MYRLFIVDDERRTRNGLAKLVNWAELGFQVTGLFTDGAEALRAFQETPADVVLTDIRMKGLSGIDLAEQLYKQYPQVRIIFISGHQDFEYARLAIRYQVQNYLLKPVRLEELRSAFMQVKEQLDALPQEGDSFCYLREEFFRFLLNGIADQNSAQKEADYFKFYFFRERYRIAVVELHNEIAYSFDQAMMTAYLGQLCGEEGVLENTSWLFRIMQNRYVLPLKAMPGNDLAQKFQRILNRSLETADIPLTIGISAVHTGCQSAAIAYRESCAALANVDQVTCYSSEKSQVDAFNQEDAVEFVRYLIEGDEAAVRSMALLAVDWLNSQSSDLSYVKNQMVQLLSNVIRKLPKNFSIGAMDYIALTQANTPEELVRVFCQNLAPVFQIAQEHKKRGFSNDFPSAMEYLRTHFTDSELSLEQLSSMIFVSPSYFSRLFKQETGENFSEYLTRTRIELAKTLLDQGLPISEAGKQAGYPNTKYFSRLFKRTTGFTASEYRARRKL